MRTPFLIALAAASAAAQPLAPPSVLSYERLTPSVGFVYYNAATGERVISRDAPTRNGAAHESRGTGAFRWANMIPDPCEGAAGVPPDAQGIGVFPGVTSEPLGDELDPNAILYWHEWFEAPGDTVVRNICLDYYSAIEDPGLDGVEGAELLLVLTENDAPGNTANARAHSPMIVPDLPGAEDENGDGEISFQEGLLWTVCIDFYVGECPVLPGIEIADTNGVYDGDGDGSVSGFRGVDTDGDGLYNCGYVIGFRQPNVSEGDGLIARFPELAGQGLENPDPYDPSTFPNIRPMGTGLYAPSSNLGSYITQPGTFSEWPSNPCYTPEIGEAIGSSDSMLLYDALGNEIDRFNVGGFACLTPGGGIDGYANPWTGWGIEFNGIRFERSPLDCDTNFDLILDLSDIVLFIERFLAGEIAADLNNDCVLDLADLNAFVGCFLANCCP